MKSAGDAQPAHAASRTEPLTPVLKLPDEHARRVKKPAIFPSQAGWWQRTEMVQDGAWFLDTGNNNPNCAMWEWVCPGEDVLISWGGRYQPRRLLTQLRLSVRPFRSAGFSCLIQARCDKSMFVLTQIAGWEWGAVRVTVDMGSKVEIQRGIAIFTLCKKGLGQCIGIKR